MALTDFIRAPSKKSLLALLKKADKLTPRLMDKLFEGVLFKSELRGFTTGGAVDHGELSGLTDDDHAQYLRKDGSRALTANWDAGAFEIRAQTLESDVATGTAPLTIASTTLVSNLNADKLDSQEGTYYLNSDNFTGTEWTDLTDSGETTLHIHDGRYYTETEINTTLTGYLPLTAGSTKPLTGWLYVDAADASIVLRDDGDTTDYSRFADKDSAFTLTKLAQSGAVSIAFNPKTNDGSSAVTIDLFRESSTTGTRNLVIYEGDGTATEQHVFNAGTGDVDLCKQGGEFTSVGAMVLPIVAQTSATLTPTNRHHTILCDGTSNTVTINLPTAAGITGRIYNIKAINVDNAVTVDANGAEEIDGSATAITLALMESITIQSDGSNWWII